MVNIIVGMLGVLLTWLVFKEQDWKSKPYSSYRHVQFTFAGTGALGWSYCLLGIAKADPQVSITLGVIILISIKVYIVYGGKVIANYICNTCDKIFK